MVNKLPIRLLGTLLVLGLAALPAAAGSIFTGSEDDGGYLLEAQAEFTFSGNQLEVLLSNIADEAVDVPSHILSGVYFDVLDPAGNVTSGLFSPVDAFLGPGSQIVLGLGTVAEPASGIGGEYGYRGDLPAAFLNGNKYGISANGLDEFGGPNLFPPGVDLDPPLSPNGMNYGILPTAGLADPTAPQFVDIPFVSNSVLFTLVAPNLTSLQGYSIANVWFQYGTSATDPGYPGDEKPPVPEPGSMVLLGLGIGAAVANSARRRWLSR